MQLIAVEQIVMCDGLMTEVVIEVLAGMWQYTSGLILASRLVIENAKRRKMSG